MNIGLLIIIAKLFVHQGEAMIVKNYGKKHGSGGMFFNAIICLFSMLYFIVSDKNGIEIPPRILCYGLVNGVLYALGFYAAYVAFCKGSFGLTRLITSFGLIITILYGVLILGEPLTPIMAVAIVMILVSVFLMNYQPGSAKENKFSLIWIISVLGIVLTNCGIAIMGRTQFGIFGDAYNNEFLMISLAGATIYLLIMGIIFERDSFKKTMKSGFLYGASAGILNGINNLLGLIVYNYINISVSAPIGTGAGIAISFLVSVLIYKEKFTRNQIISAIIGIIAVVLMNLK